MLSKSASNVYRSLVLSVRFQSSFLSKLKTSPINVYLKFYENQYHIGHNREEIQKILSKIKTLDSSDFLKKLIKDGQNLLDSNNVLPTKLYDFFINYLELVYSTLKDRNIKFSSQYRYLFTNGFMKELYTMGDHTQLFFTFDKVDDEDLIHIRPTCLYLNYLLDIPDISSSSFDEFFERVEGNSLDVRDITFHDLGHSYVMKRQDKWLFESLTYSTPVELIEKWVHNKDRYYQEYSKLKDSNYLLYRAVRLCLFDIVHDRGYQFYLPILRQQISALKNLENIKTKLIHGNFENIVNDIHIQDLLNHLDEARTWLTSLTDKFIVEDNLSVISINNIHGYNIKRYLPVASHRGVPIDVIIEKGGKISVNFLCKRENDMDVIVKASLYEIELLSVSNTDIIFTEEVIYNLNDDIRILNSAFGKHIPSIQLDSDINFYDSRVNYNNHGFILGPNFSLHDFTEFDLKPIEIFKLERVFHLIRLGQTVKFSVTERPFVYDSNRLELINNTVIIDTGIAFNIKNVHIEPKVYNTLKYINLDPHARFISEDEIRNAYITSSYTDNPSAEPYVTIDDELELGIVNTENNLDLAKAVSSLLSRSIDDAKASKGGYLPDNIVERAQTEYVSPSAISSLWGRSGYRFILSRKVENTDMREIIGTALIANSKDTLFFYTNKYNNLRYSAMKNDVDFDMKFYSNVTDQLHQWFDKYNMPNISVYKPIGYNQLANFAIEKLGYRGKSLGKLLIEEIVRHYAVHYAKRSIIHSQPLICDKGLFQIADPSWREFMLKIGFKHRYRAETFYVDNDWDPLPEIVYQYRIMTNVEYNSMFNMPNIYNSGGKYFDPEIHIPDRVDEVIKLSKSDNHKLQYFQLLYPFDQTNTSDNSRE